MDSLENVVTKELLEELYINQRKTMKEVCKAIGIKSEITLRKYMKMYNIAPRNVNKENSLLTRLGYTDEQFKNELYDLYINQKVSSNQLAERYNVSHVIIKRYLLKYGIDTRTRSESITGTLNPRWNGGQRNKDGYIEIYMPEHPYCNKSRKTVYAHRLVMEKHLGRYLQPNEVIHHINRNKSDNRIENLQLLTPEEHAKIHGNDTFHRIKKKNLNRWSKEFDKCIICGTTERKHTGHGLCWKCYKRSEFYKENKRTYKFSGIKWSRNYDKCIKCGSNEYRHSAKGLCVRCYKNEQYHIKNRLEG